MALQYPKENRMYTDNINDNGRFYRESEAHARIDQSNNMLREDFGFEKKIYEHIHDPNETYQEIQGKLYRSE